MPKSKVPSDPLVTELVALKKLLIFALLRSGASQAQIGMALDMDQSQVSRMFPRGTGVPKK
jgi:hypothetical protein